MDLKVGERAGFQSQIKIKIPLWLGQAGNLVLRQQEVPIPGWSCLADEIRLLMSPTVDRHPA